MSILDAVVAPRLHAQLLPYEVRTEGRKLLNGDIISIPIAVIDYLQARGHALKLNDDFVGNTQFIAIDPDSGLIEGVSDPRKNGHPAAQ